MLLQPALGCDQGPGTFRSLDHDHDVRQGGHGPVAGGKVVTARCRPVRELADQRPAGRKNLLCELAVCRGIDDIDAGAHHGDGDSAAYQGPPMSCSIDAEGEPADHYRPRSRELGGKLLGDGFAVGRWEPRTDDRHAWALRRRPAAAGPELSSHFPAWHATKRARMAVWIGRDKTKKAQVANPGTN